MRGSFLIISHGKTLILFSYDRRNRSLQLRLNDLPPLPRLQHLTRREQSAYRQCNREKQVAQDQLAVQRLTPELDKGDVAQHGFQCVRRLRQESGKVAE